MKDRFENASGEATDLLKEVRAEYFPELRNAKIKVIFDLKKRTSKGRLSLAKISKTTDLIRLLTVDQVDPIEGFDYIITLDKECWNAIDKADRVRILRHELRHGYFDIDSEDNPYKIIGHDITDFHAEVDANRDDPMWRERVASLTDAIYEQRKEDEAPKKRKGGRLF